MIDISSNNEYFNISKDQLIRELVYMKNKFQFNILQDCFGLRKYENISIYYQLFSKKLSKVIFLFIEDCNPSIKSITSIFPNANWYEREIFEQFGLTFIGHPDLKKLMLY